MKLIEPIDDVHRESVMAIKWLRVWFQEAHARVAEWTPEPVPDWWE